MPMVLPFKKGAASSKSPMTWTPRARAWLSRSRSAGTPGEITARSALSRADSVCGSIVIPKTSPVAFSSTARTHAPCSRNNFTAAIPDRAIPTTTTFKPSSFNETSKTDSLTVAAQLPNRVRSLPSRDRKGVGCSYLSFNVVNANKAMTNPAIQKRVMIFDSCQPSASK